MAPEVTCPVLLSQITGFHRCSLSGHSFIDQTPLLIFLFWIVLGQDSLGLISLFSGRTKDGDVQ